jgi:Tol biopolymer transport system component
MSWSRDGHLVVSQSVPGHQFDVVLYDVAAKRALPRVATPANETQGVLSPSAHALVYVSNESGP